MTEADESTINDLYSHMVLYTSVDLSPVIPTISLVVTDPTSQILDQLWIQHMALTSESGRQSTSDLLTVLFYQGLLRAEDSSNRVSTPEDATRLAGEAFQYVVDIVNKADRETGEVSVIPIPEDAPRNVFVIPQEEEDEDEY